MSTSALDRCQTCNLNPAGIVINRRICTVADRIPVAMPMMVLPLPESKMGRFMIMSLLLRDADCIQLRTRGNAQSGQSGNQRDRYSPSGNLTPSAARLADTVENHFVPRSALLYRVPVMRNRVLPITMPATCCSVSMIDCLFTVCPFEWVCLTDTFILVQ